MTTSVCKQRENYFKRISYLFKTFLKQNFFVYCFEKQQPESVVCYYLKTGIIDVLKMYQSLSIEIEKINSKDASMRTFNSFKSFLDATFEKKEKESLNVRNSYEASAPPIRQWNVHSGCS